MYHIIIDVEDKHDETDKTFVHCGG